MERHLPYVKKILVSLFAIASFSSFFCTGFISAQETEGSYGSRKILFQLTTQMDAFPELELREGTDSPFHDGHIIDFSPAQKNDSVIEGYEDKRKYLLDYSIDSLKTLAPFVLEGMIYGWNWEYTPSDKARKVKEYFEFSRIHEFSEEVNKISYLQPEIIDSTALRCWVKTERTELQYLSLREWNSVKIPRIHGIGSGSLEKDFDGIKEAVQNAIKDAVREYFRTTLKNKPKELTGRVLLTGTPQIFIKQGRYFAELDFFIETDKIIMYTSY